MIFIKWRFIIRTAFGLCICRYREKNRFIESDRDWVKDMSCSYHWRKTKWYKDKMKLKEVKDGTE